jgi:hypothetical protein
VLVDPENGDYGLAPGSPAVGYGCQTFLDRGNAGESGDPPPPDIPLRRGEIEVSGSITKDTTWDVEKVKVVGSVQVEDGVRLTVAPGVLVEFQGYYRLSVQGTLLAVGTPEKRIRFTIHDPQNFTVDHTYYGCWNGIRFHDTRATNDASRIEHCILEYSKAVTGEEGVYAFGGGAVSVHDFSKLTVANCIIRRNVAVYGGAFFLFRNANPKIIGNMIYDNHALETASAFYCSYSYPSIVNNTIVRNIIHNELNPYIDTCAMLNFLAKPAFYNNIIRDNNPVYYYYHAQMWKNKVFYTWYNNIGEYTAPNGNIDAVPLFVDAEGGDYHLTAGSPCIDAGCDDAPWLNLTDVDGDWRKISFHGGVVPMIKPPPEVHVDIGADEYCRFSRKSYLPK